MTLNRTLYDALPYAYIGAGLLCWFLLDPQYRLMPALMVASAGLIVLFWRRRTRVHNADRKHRRQASRLRSR